MATINDLITTENDLKAALAEIERLRAAFRVNMLRLDPTISHAEIDRILNGVEQSTPQKSLSGSDDMDSIYNPQRYK